MLTLAGADLARVVAHCRRELPNEACGILGGRAGRVESVHPVRSARPSPGRYEMDPAEQWLALDEIDRAGWELVGIYHSHPAAPAMPSPSDLEAACWPGTNLPNYPGAVYLIVSLLDRAVPAVKGYVLAVRGFVEVPIEIDP